MFDNAFEVEKREKEEFVVRVLEGNGSFIRVVASSSSSFLYAYSMVISYILCLVLTLSGTLDELKGINVFSYVHVLYKKIERHWSKLL